MTYATEWNDVYRNNSHMSIWPWSDLVSSVYRYANPRDGYQRVLELGCGAGANIPLFLKENFDYYSIEGSENIVKKLIAIYPELSKKILVGDFTNKNSFLKDNFFDLVVDRGSITCNDTNAITNTLKHVVEYLRPGGKIICIDWYSSVHSDSKTGDYIDAHTRTNLPADSHLNRIGKVHFSDKEHILELFKKSDLIIEKLEHKEKSQELPNNKIHFASWDIIARKPV